ncbi:symmetrical bis(5'-nucleosyl)-tetraphosphatase [Gammaproteobacteria bacterium]|nr:symmetrical bis(5'-nucleosyl)-tetraphosphatase [Gammaproteobacteria bacterium]
MACYVVGDIHGCLAQLQQLMITIDYTPSDRIIFLGDYVGRGPNSLGVLKYLKSLENAVCVLGNHDLHLLYDYYVQSDHSQINPDFHPIFESPDAKDIMQWVRTLPLAHRESDAFFVHAGLYPEWSADEAMGLIKIANDLLKGANYKWFLSQMYGNFPDHWDHSLQQVDRFRFILNVCTRMRYLTPSGHLDFSENLPPWQVKNKIPWYEKRQERPVIYFGHWASLQGKVHTQYVHAMDGGCVWGGSLMAMNIETGEKYEVRHA